MRQASIETICEFVLDGTHGSPVRSEQGVPVLSAQNIGNGYIDWSSDRYTTASEYDAFKKRVDVRSGDVLLTIVGTIGRAAVVDIPKPSVFQRSVAILRPVASLVDSRYFYQATRHRAFQDHLRRQSNASAQAGVYLGKLKEVTIPLPPLPEQRRIAAILDAADALRQKRRQALRLLDQLSQAIFIEMFGDPLVNPRGWDNGALLGEHAEIVSGITKGRKLNGKPTREIPYLAVYNVQDRALRLDQVKTIEATEDEIERYRLKRDDLLLTEGGDPDKLGRGTLWNDELPECIHQNHIFRVRLRSRDLEPVFLNWLIGSEHGKRYFLRSAKQTTGIASINMGQLRSFPLLMPPLQLQSDFRERLEQLRAIRDRAAVHTSQLGSLFASLQHRAFRGEL